MQIFAWVEQPALTNIIYSGFGTSVEAKQWKSLNFTNVPVWLVRFEYGNFEETKAVWDDTPENQLTEALDFFVSQTLNRMDEYHGPRSEEPEAYAIFDHMLALLEGKLGLLSNEGH